MLVAVWMCRLVRKINLFSICAEEKDKVNCRTSQFIINVIDSSF